MFFHFQSVKHLYERFHPQKAFVPTTSIRWCSRGLELMQKATDDGRMTAKSTGYYIWRVTSHQSSSGPFNYSGGWSLHHGFQKMTIASELTYLLIGFIIHSNLSRLISDPGK